MRVVLLDTTPWREAAIARMLARVGGIAAQLERDVADRSAVAVTLVSEQSVRDDERYTIANIEHKFPNANILILGNSDDPATIAEFMKAGADGYFEMQLGEEKLVQAVNVVARGAFWLPEHSMRSVVKTLHALPESLDALSEAERAILDMLSEGLTNKDMANRLGVAEIVVKTQLRKLLRRFRVRTRVQLLTQAVRRGFVSRG